MQILIAAILGVFWGASLAIGKLIKDEIEINKRIKEWDKNSFQYKGMKFNKKFFKLVDGKPVMTSEGASNEK